MFYVITSKKDNPAIKCRTRKQVLEALLMCQRDGIVVWGVIEGKSVALAFTGKFG